MTDPARDLTVATVPRKGVTAQVDCGDGAVMTIINPFHAENVEWMLRYGNPMQVRYVAASLLDSYDYLLSNNLTMKEATRRLRLMRARRMALREEALASSGYRS